MQGLISHQPLTVKCKKSTSTNISVDFKFVSHGLEVQQHQTTDIIANIRASNRTRYINIYARHPLTYIKKYVCGFVYMN
jgi:hypothetical protein